MCQGAHVAGSLGDPFLLLAVKRSRDAPVGPSCRRPHRSYRRAKREQLEERLTPRQDVRNCGGEAVATIRPAHPAPAAVRALEPQARRDPGLRQVWQADNCETAHSPGRGLERVHLGHRRVPTVRRRPRPWINATLSLPSLLLRLYNFTILTAYIYRCRHGA
jgi:hypothetical protein